jgi:hypothetical protein
MKGITPSGYALHSRFRLAERGPPIWGERLDSSHSGRSSTARAPSAQVGEQCGCGVFLLSGCPAEARAAAFPTGKECNHVQGQETPRAHGGLWGSHHVGGRRHHRRRNGAKFRADLSGEHLASAGDTDGWGRAKIRVDDTFNELCVDLEVRSIGEVTSAQIHRGVEGVEGPAVVNLDRPDDDSDSEDCDNIGDELADEIQANPPNSMS